MQTEVVLPKLSDEEDARATLNQWLVAEGDPVAPEQDLVEVLTDKVALTLPAPVGGRLTSIRVPEGVQVAFAYAITWFLLLGAVRPVAELRAHRRAAPGAPTDADVLARLTHVPAPAWVALFGLATVAASGAGAWLLLT